MTSVPPSFPSDFVWGTATAAYQIEGAVTADGRGESIWDRFSHTPGNTHNDDNGDTACDHYNRWREDIELMSDLGTHAYRFSIAWPRVMPGGTGAVNLAGLDFYDQLVDGLLEAGITPFPTLYHWDLPQALEDRGGWTKRATAYAFAEFVSAVGQRLGDRVRDWWTINEPWCVAELGYRNGEHAPGRRDPAAAIAATHHVLLAHGLGMRAMKAAAPNARLGIAVNTDAHIARSSHPADVAAAELAHDVNTRLYLDPIMLGEYPASAVEYHGWDGAEISPGDMDLIATPIDHLGVNYYTRRVSLDPTIADSDRPAPLVETDLPRTTMGWEIYADGLTEVLLRFHNDYELPPTFISESGVAFVDEIVDGAIRDEGRRKYLEDHFAAAANAIAAGVPLRGYFVWTLLDNFEWQHAYNQRFGLVHTDFPTQRRTIKDSGHWFATVAKGTSPNQIRRF